MRRPWTTIVMVMAASAAVPAVLAAVAMDWLSIDGGASFAVAGPTIELSATVGQPEATLVVTGPTVASVGGFWAVTAQLSEMTPREEVELLRSQVQALVPDPLRSQRAKPLLSKLREAIKNLDRGRIRPAINKLRDFIDQLNALINSGELTAEQAQPLIDAANSIINQLGG